MWRERRCGVMGQLSERLAVVLQKYGSDPAAHQSDLQSLAALERTDPKAALERFHELKRVAAVHRRGELLASLRRLGFVDDVPAHDTRGMDAKEIEREIREFTRALHEARDVAESLAAADESARRLGERTASWDRAAFARVPYAGLAQAAERADAARRALAREARVAQRADDARRRAKRLRELRVEVPDVASARVPDAAEADALLEASERALDEAERVEEAHERAVKPLRDPAVARWKGNSRKAIVDEAKRLLEARDAAGLDALAPRAEKLRVEAARAAEEASRSRRSGRAGPKAETRAGDLPDYFG